MKILVVCDRLEIFGGLEQHVITQCNKLQENGNEIVLYTNALLESNRKIINKNIKIISPWTKNCFEDIGNFIPDIVHSHPFTAISRAYDIAKKYNKSLYITMHGLYNYGFDDSEFGKKIGNYISRVFAVDYAVENILRQSINCENNKIITIYNGIDLNSFYYTKPSVKLFNELKLKKEFKTLGIITRYDDGKEIPVYQLLQILPQIAERTNGLNVLFVGGGSHLSKIINMANTIMSEKLNIVFTNSVTNVRQYINLCDFMCASARTAVEIICCGKNVFQMGIGKWGVLIDKNNYKQTLFDITYYTDYKNEDLTNHLVWCLNNPEAINNVTNGLYEIIREECNIENIINKLEKAYKGEL